MSNCLVTKLKGVVDNPNLPYFAEVVFNGNFTKKDLNDYSVNLGNVNEGDSFVVTLKANYAIEATQPLNLYIKATSVISNVIDLRGVNLLMEKTYIITATAANNNAIINIYSEKQFNEVIFTGKIQKLYQD